MLNIFCRIVCCVWSGLIHNISMATNYIFIKLSAGFDLHFIVYSSASQAKFFNGYKLYQQFFINVVDTFG